MKITYELREQTLPVNKCLIPFTQQEKKAILQSSKNIIVTNKTELKKLVLEAINNKDAKNNLYLGVIPPETILRIKNEITDIKQEKIDNLLNAEKNYGLVINQEEIRHLNKESLTIQEVINFINSLDKIIINFDFVRYTVYSKKQNALRFKKRLSSGTYIALEVISTQKKTFRTQTIFIIKTDFIAKKRKFTPTLNE